MITSLHLKDFRGFKQLDLEELQRINLIVGRNNAGKTSLLEAITVLADPLQIGKSSGLFRTYARNTQQAYIRWLMRDGRDVSSIHIDAIYNAEPRKVTLFKTPPNPQIRRITQVPGNTTGQVSNLSIEFPSSQSPLGIRVISVQPQTPDEIVKSFGAAVAQKGGEERMDKLFHDMDNRIRKVRVLSAGDGFQIRFDLNLSEMIPLSQMGQGVNRLITIFSQLIVEDTDICMIDEIENGLHHSMLEQVWTGIAVAAESLNIQIFATTHSYECIEAAHAAFSKRNTYDFSITQLFRSSDGIQGRVLDEKHIKAALAGEIDLR